MLCNETRALGARNKNTQNMLLAFINVDEIFSPLSEITSTDMVSSRISLIHTKLYIVSSDHNSF